MLKLNPGLTWKWDFLIYYFYPLMYHTGIEIFVQWIEGVLIYRLDG